ncbi:MAG: amidohydrolase [Woeseiaceae bacterium]|nr:amidohydrolase [Woeseiaceae bacterium]
MRLIGYLCCLAVAAGCSPGQPPADRVFLNGAVYTVDADSTWAEAVAVARGRIAFVGSNEAAQAFIGDATEVTDLGGQMLLPGFHDSHAHILLFVQTGQECDLLRLETIEEIEAKLEKCTQLAGFGQERWILGAGWGEWLFESMSPTRELLDELFPDRPVCLEGSYGHSYWVNSRALEIAGIDAETTVGDDGVIVRDPETGEATGTLHDSAMLLVEAHMPEMPASFLQDKVRAGIAMLHEHGITAFIEPGFDDEMIQHPVAVADAGEFDIRALISMSPVNLKPAAFDDSVYDLMDRRQEWRRPNLDVDSVKIYMDGVIESGTSPLLEPYAIEEYGAGPFFYTQEQVNEYFTRLDARGLQLHVHAIGDAAIRRALDGFEYMREQNGMSDNRHHMTHLQLIHPDDRPRFGELGIGATFQLLWAYPEPGLLEMTVPMLGRERAWQTYPARDVHEGGGRINGASDWWVTDIDPLLAIETAITRQDPWANEGEDLDAANQSLDLATMIEAYTINGAYTMSLENEQGSIEVGKRADLVVLDRNLFEIPAYEISDARVTMTIFDGRTVYRSPE